MATAQFLSSFLTPLVDDDVNLVELAEVSAVLRDGASFSLENTPKSDEWTSRWKYLSQTYSLDQCLSIHCISPSAEKSRANSSIK
jgi:hypothetical protein